MTHEEELNKAAEEYTQKMLESWRFDSTGRRPPRESFIAGAKWMESQFELIYGKEKGEDYGFTFDKNASIDVYIRKKDE